MKSQDNLFFLSRGHVDLAHHFEKGFHIEKSRADWVWQPLEQWALTEGVEPQALDWALYLVISQSGGVDIVVASLTSILSCSHFVTAPGLEWDWPPRSERGPWLVWSWVAFPTFLVIGSGLGNGSTVDPFYLLMVGRHFILPLFPIPCFPLFLQVRWVSKVPWYLMRFELDWLLAS